MSKKNTISDETFERNESIARKVGIGVAKARLVLSAHLSAIGRKGGSVTSEAKAKASRENGKRPKTKRV